MFFGGVDVAVAEYVRHHVDVARRAVEVGAVGAAQFVRGDLFERRGDRGIFLDQILHRAHAYPPDLQGEKECVRVADFEFLRAGYQRLAFAFDVVFESFLDVLVEVEYGAAAALAGDGEGVGVEIYVLYVQPHAFAHSYACAQQQGEYRHVACARVEQYLALVRAHAFAVLGGVQDLLDLVSFQPDYLFFALFGQRDLGGDVDAEFVFVEKILEKAAYGRDLARFSAVAVAAFLAVELVAREILHIVFQVRYGDLFHVGESQLVCGHPLERAHPLHQIVEKYAQIVRISQPRKRSGLRLDSHEKLVAEFRQSVAYFPEAQIYVAFAFLKIVRHIFSLRHGGRPRSAEHSRISSSRRVRRDDTLFIGNILTNYSQKIKS